MKTEKENAIIKAYEALARKIDYIDKINDATAKFYTKGFQDHAGYSLGSIKTSVKGTELYRDSKGIQKAVAKKEIIKLEIKANEAEKKLGYPFEIKVYESDNWNDPKGTYVMRTTTIDWRALKNPKSVIKKIDKYVEEQVKEKETQKAIRLSNDRKKAFLQELFPDAEYSYTYPRWGNYRYHVMEFKNGISVVFDAHIIPKDNTIQLVVKEIKCDLPIPTALHDVLSFTKLLSGFKFSNPKED